MQFFHLFSFVVVASYAVALPQPAGLSEKYSNSADTNLVSGLEARSYQPGLNSQKDSATLTLLKRQDDSDFDPFFSSTSGPNGTVGSDFTEDDVSSENLASTINKVGDDVHIFFKDGEKIADKIGGYAGGLIRKCFRRHAYVNVAIRRWVQASLSDIRGFIESSLGEDEYSKIEPEFTESIERLKGKFKEELISIVDTATKILNNEGSDIENVEKISASFGQALFSRVGLLLALESKLASFGNGATLGGQLSDVTTSVNDFMVNQSEPDYEMMQALKAASSQ
ncbi:hypothetical protein BASA82_000392 [Batrachochytrium salamandrivorans]|uniref:Uncharacterized protein n=1 Tax=Batrachochytrium salamandrivorans TaxID=1357716 RepID=A0ABQ8FF12_9FUNG|nr:hypothetical protein BASA60_003083 [Batrachochytrium salamandrivorans]KAH6597219.1 hypothetical protein BASA50_004571 [Batrachochytrium salamandrivorans]KAH6602576.1 hypothetical protein BASA61_000969 [Batrachochytrium salamandrivorans]KAH9258774.1 hypothetical protein BASA81_002838 [Batrachochytrium salamandrivorans]KAH9262563.1 hypothetical protein BASA82_000392 [Batrachochytrium salamandrivorans]